MLHGPDKAITLLLKIVQASCQFDVHPITARCVLVKSRQLAALLPDVEQLTSADGDAGPGATKSSWPPR